MNHLCFNIPSGNLSSLPHTVFNSETVKEHLAFDLEHNSVSISFAVNGNSFILKGKLECVEAGKFLLEMLI